MKIRLLNSWRPGEWHPEGRTMLFHPGDYRVPEDISEELAARAVAEGAAVAEGGDDGGKSKGRAPENKSLTDQKGRTDAR